MAMLRARFSRLGGADHEARVISRGPSHSVKLTGPQSRLLFLITRDWIHSWSERGDEDYRVHGVDLEFLAVQGAVFPADSALRDSSVFDYSVHPSSLAMR